MILYLAHRYEEAATLLLRACEANPDHFLRYLRLGLVRVQQRQYDDAIAALKTAMRLADRSTETVAALGMAYAASGKPHLARQVVSRLERLKGKRYVLPYNIAKIFAAPTTERRRCVAGDAYEGGNPDLIELLTRSRYSTGYDDPNSTT
jgi:tetratricopeptide (TPR) repeat protein